MLKCLLLTLLFLSCTREYSVEKIQSKINFDTTLTGTGNDSWKIKIPPGLVGEQATVNFYVTEYSSTVDSLGRNDYVYQLGATRLPIKKFNSNPVWENQLTISGRVILTDTLIYFTTTYFVLPTFSPYDRATWPIFRDTIRVLITKG